MSKCTKCNGLGEIVNDWQCLQCDTWNSYTPDYINSNGNITCGNCGKFWNLHNSKSKARIAINSSTCTNCNGFGYISDNTSEKKGCLSILWKIIKWIFIIIAIIVVFAIIFGN